MQDPFNPTSLPQIPNIKDLDVLTPEPFIGVPTPFMTPLPKAPITKPVDSKEKENKDNVGKQDT